MTLLRLRFIIYSCRGPAVTFELALVLIHNAGYQHAKVYFGKSLKQSYTEFLIYSDLESLSWFE